MSPNGNFKPTVWVIHDKGGYDFSKAAEHGEVKVVFKGEFNPFDLPAARHRAEECMKESGPHDWLIAVGSGIADIIVAQAYIAQHDRLPLLVFHSQRRDYVKRELSNFRIVG